MKICGLDECGRGAFAGPLVAAAVIINAAPELLPALLPAPLRDSKKLSEIQRNRVISVLPALPVTYRIEEISVSEINEYGMGWANRQIFERLFTRLKATVYIVDGNLRFENPAVRTLIRGDDKCFPVMLAGIIAKVHRDNLMSKLHLDFPAYGWNINSGYGTPGHLDAIKNIGVTPLHRLKYVETYLGHHPH